MSDVTAEHRLAVLAVTVMCRLLDDGAAEQACLQWLATQCVEHFEVRAAGVLLADEAGMLDVAAASDDSAHALQRLATTSGEGPGPACYHRGSMLVVRDLRVMKSRWPHYAESAQRLGVNSVCSLPLRQRQAQRKVGVLNLFSSLGGPPVLKLRGVQVIADAVAEALLVRRAVQAARQQAVRVPANWHSQALVEQAKGALSERWGTDIDTAFEALRRHARAVDLPIEQVARAVVESPRDTDPFA